MRISSSVDGCYLDHMAAGTPITLDDNAYESAKACSAALGQTMTEWLNNAVRAAARRQNAAAFLAWEATARPDRPDQPDELDDATAAASVDGAAW